MAFSIRSDTGSRKRHRVYAAERLPVSGVMEWEFLGLLEALERELAPFAGAALLVMCKHPREVALINKAAGQRDFG
jgi:hypothetical protein